MTWRDDFISKDDKKLSFFVLTMENKKRATEKVEKKNWQNSRILNKIMVIVPKQIIRSFVTFDLNKIHKFG